MPKQSRRQLPSSGQGHEPIFRRRAVIFPIASVLALATSIGLGVVGQLGLKAGALEDAGRGGWVPHPYVVIGLFFYAVSAVFYVYALRRIPVSVAFPSVSISYVIVAYLASMIWGEPFGRAQVMALVAIGIGVVLLFQYSQ